MSSSVPSENAQCPVSVAKLGVLTVVGALGFGLFSATF